jgi:hypothetical protein
MSENPDKHEKLKSHEDEDDDVTTSDSNESESTEEKGQKTDVENSKDTEPKSEGLASFFKTKAERQKEEQELAVEKQPLEQTEHETIKDEVEQEVDENLTNQEVQEATIAIADARTQEVSEELNSAEPDSVDEFVALADAVFLESLKDLASEDTEVTPELIEAAFDEALDDLSLDDNPVEAADAPPDLLEPAEVADVPTDDDELDPNAPPVAPVIPPTPPVVPPVPQSGPNIIPPNPPVPLPSGGAAYNYGPPPIGPNFNQNPNTANSPNVAPVIVQEIYNQHSDLLLGIIVGYLIGRRGGRKRTEKKLIPKIDKLEEQVKTLHDTILEKEVKIRKIARENAEEIKRKLELNSAVAPVSAALILERRKTRKEVKETLKRREILASDPGVEKIGKFSLPALKVFHERRLPDGTENSPLRKRVEVMNTFELLEKVEGLVIHDLRVTEMYHRGRLSDDALRQITREYLRSGPYEQTFFQELLPDPEHIETLKKQVIEKNIINSVDETSRNQFVVEPSKRSGSEFPLTQKKTRVFEALKKQKNYVISGFISAVTLVAILAVFMLLR